MKRKILSVLCVLMAVLMALTALAACEKTPAGAENNGGSGESVSTAESSGESSEQSALNESKNSSIIIPDEPYENEPEESKKEYVPSVTPGKKASVQADFSDLREFVLSKESAQLVLSMTDGSFYSAEPCAYYGSIATYQLYNGTDRDFCTFRIEKNGEYTMEALACRESEIVSGLEGEFYPTQGDGYPAEAFSSYEFYDILPDDCDLDFAKKVEYVITAVGSGQAVISEDHIRRMREAAESVKLLPIERFTTSTYGPLFISNKVSYYENTEDEEPYCVIYTNLVGVKTAADASRLYYPESPEEYDDRLSDVYFAILDELSKKVQSP